MKTILVRSIVVIATCGWAATAYGGPVSFGGSVNLAVDMSDGALTTLPNAQHLSDGIDFTADVKAVSGTKSLGATVGSVGAAGDASYRAGPGQLGVYAHTIANAVNTGYGLQINSVAGARTIVVAEMTDTWHFRAKNSGKHFHVNGSFTLRSDLTTSADGVYGRAANFYRDSVEAHATAVLHVGGTGMPDGPYLSHGPRDIFGYFGEQVSPSTINAHFAEQAPKTIPTSVEIKGDTTWVSWTMVLETESVVAAHDVINHLSGTAIAIGDILHTLAWDGITSVTDADTGALVTDWTLISDSGFDYTAATVPDPPSLLLLGTGLSAWLGLVLLRRWRAVGPGG